MRTPAAESFHRLGELALLTTAFVLPLAFHLRSYDSNAIKFTVLQWGSLTMLFGWLWQGISRGRFSAPASSWTVLLPALAYGAWMIVRFATEPYKLGALPEFLTQLTMLVGFLAAFLGFAGARSASRFATLTVAAAWLVALYGLLQAAGLDPLVWKGAFGKGVLGDRAFSTLGNPYLCASFLAVAVPLALTLELDAETPAALRYAALMLLPIAGAAVVLTGSSRGVFSFCVSCLLYAAIVPAALRTRPALKSAGLALLAAAAVAGAAALTSTTIGDRRPEAAELRRLNIGAELRMLAERPLTGFGPGSFSIHSPRFRSAEIIKLDNGRGATMSYPEIPLLGVAVELGAAGAALWLWLFGAALWTGARGASALRRAGALPESVYAAGFAAAAAGILTAAHFGWAGYSPAPAWFAWPLAGLAAGLAPLAARRAAVSVYPLPVSESIRRALYAPALLTFAGLAVMPGLWLRSEVNLNTAIFYAKWDKDASKASAMFDRVLPGSAGYTMAQYFHGNVLNDAGRYAEALAVYDRLQAQAPDYVLVHARRGEAYAKLGDWTAAAAERSRQAELDPLYLENLLAWAEAARASGNLEQARFAAAKASALDPHDERVRLQIAANDLMERRLLAKSGQGKTNGHGTARKPR
ncbi:MAG: tetratricopeptide repeat protein [Elusimicrobia bacterium]|nr:tetratricopeptide repeat protein [Elusimicrobiota bacterium]